jgi:hypothetical protein
MTGSACSTGHARVPTSGAGSTTSATFPAGATPSESPGRAQPIGQPGAKEVVSQLRLVDLASGRSRILAEGRVSSPVVAGPDLVWASASSSGRFDHHAVDATTTAAVTLPSTLGDPGSIGFLGGSADTLAWSSSDGTQLTVWSRGSGTRRRFRSEDGVHFFQFLQLAGPYLAWFAAGSSAIMDVRTGAGFDVAGSVSAAVDDLVIAPVAVRKGAAPAAGHVTRVRLSSAPRLPGCEERMP